MSRARIKGLEETWSLWEVKSLCASLDGPLHLSPRLIEWAGTECMVNIGLGSGEEEEEIDEGLFYSGG